MGKMRIIAEGTQFMEDWNAASSGIVGVKVNGNSVQTIWKDGRTTDSFIAGQKIQKLVWSENGSVHAVCADGSIQYATNLSTNPNNRPAAYDIEVHDKNGKMYQGKGSDADADVKKKEKKEKKTRSGGGKKSSGWWWKWPFKGLWWLFKFIFIMTIFGDDKNK